MKLEDYIEQSKSKILDGQPTRIEDKEKLLFYLQEEMNKAILPYAT